MSKETKGRKNDMTLTTKTGVTVTVKNDGDEKVLITENGYTGEIIHLTSEEAEKLSKALLDQTVKE